MLRLRDSKNESGFIFNTANRILVHVELHSATQQYTTNKIV